jgi:isopentenyl diphosphate isomerase/L-lactate dehydrogenase-like FMN-dependent dehydrogenase
MARAASATLHGGGTTATTSLEEVRKAATGPTWFQLYIYQDRGATRAPCSSAPATPLLGDRDHGRTPLLGWRERDIRSNFTLPPHLTIANAIAAGAGYDRFPPPTAKGSGWPAPHALHDAALSPRDIEWARVSGFPSCSRGSCEETTPCGRWTMARPA